MTKAVVFFDLDLTLLNDDKQVPVNNQRAVKQLMAADCLPVLCTGKNYWETDFIRSQTDIQNVIGANGADIFLNGRQIFEQSLSPKLLARFLAHAAADRLPVAMYNHQQVQLTVANESTRLNYEMMAQPQPGIQPLFYESNPIVMMLLFSPNNQQGARDQARYAKLFPELNFFRNGPYAIDVVSRTCSKGQGVRDFLRHASLETAPTYAFGDGNNDISMLQQVDCGIAMGNALPQVKAVADYVTADYRHDGIAAGLRHFNLIH